MLRRGAAIFAPTQGSAFFRLYSVSTVVAWLFCAGTFQPRLVSKQIDQRLVRHLQRRVREDQTFSAAPSANRGRLHLTSRR